MDQEVDEEFDDELEDEESEEDIEEQMSAEQKRQFEIEEKILKNQLRATMARISGGAIALNMSEKQTMKKAKAHPNLKKEMTTVNLILVANKTKLAMKTMSASPVLYYVFIGVAILFLVICVVAFIGSIMPWLFPNEDGSTGDVSSAFGITGKDFYGARMVYRNDEKASISIIEDYVELVESGINETKTLETGELTLTINITLPDDEFDYSQFEENDFKSQHAVLYNTVFDIAKAVYNVDNSATYSGTSLIECVDGILYFGFNQTIMADVSGIVSNAISTNTTVSDGSDVSSQIQSKIGALYSQPKYDIRTEKLFVKDFILDGEDDKVKGISKENYVAFIFMPKNSVTFKKLSFSAGNADLSEFEIKLLNNGSEISLKKDDSDFGGESGNTYIYTSNENVNVSASMFADIDANNLSALSAGLSLFDVVESVDNYSLYLQENENSVYTVKKNGVVAELNNKEAFNFVEFETTWQAAS